MSAKTHTSDPLDERSSLLRSGEIDAACLLDGETGRILDANLKLGKLLGVERSAVIGRDLAELSTDPTAVRDTLKGARVGVAAAQVTAVSFARTGTTPIATELCLASFVVEGRPIVSAVLRDLTARTETIEALKRRVERTGRQRTALIELSTLDVPEFEDRLRHILRIDARTLEVERVSMWTLRSEPPVGDSAASPESIVLDALYRRGPDAFDAGIELFARDYPRYFGALAEGSVISAGDAHDDARTSEFSADYLRPFGIGAMLDIPVYVHRKLVGVVCHEHVGGPREFSVDEEQFAMSIGQMMSLALLGREREEVLRHAALHDPLTGLPNRVLFFEHCQHAIARAKRHEGMFAVLYADLDGFKAINDRHGHAAGDELLRGIATRLVGCLRPSDVAARIGGDEIVVLLGDLRGAGEAMSVAGRIAEVLQSSQWLGGKEVRTTASIGVVVAGSQHDSPDALLRDADAAMYRAKSLGKARVELAGGA